LPTIWAQRASVSFVASQEASGSSGSVAGLGTGRPEALGLDPPRVVPEVDERARRDLDEGGRPADVDERALLRRPGDVLEELPVDPSPVPPPPFGLRAGQREPDVDPVSGSPLRELLPVDDVVQRPCR